MSDNHDSIENEELWFTVKVEALIEEDDLEDEDRDVPGEYEFFLPAEAKEWTPSRQAKTVLDYFHNSVAIGTLDDFNIEVINDQGVEIFEEFDDEDGED